MACREVFGGTHLAFCAKGRPDAVPSTGCWFCAATACLFLLLSSAVDNAAPRLQVNDGVWDFGAVTNLQELTHDFAIRNEGDRPLEIEKVVSSCDACLSAAVDKKSIPSGETALLRCRLDLRRLSGRISRTATLFSNDTEHPSFVFGVTGVSVPLFQVDPTEVYLDLGSGQQTGLAQILPLVKLHAPLSRVLLDKTNMIADISQESPAKFRLTVRPLPTLPKGRTKIAAKVLSAHPADPACLVELIIDNPPDLEVIPAALQLEPKVGPQSRMVLVRQHGPNPMTLVDVLAPSDKFQLTVEPDPSGLKYRIDIQAWDQRSTTGKTNNLLLKMRDQSNREHTIPVPVTVAEPKTSNE